MKGMFYRVVGICFLHIAIFALFSCDNKNLHLLLSTREEIPSTKLDLYQEEERDFNGLSSQGGVLYNYKDQGSLRAQVVYILGEMGKVKCTFDYTEDGNIFIVENIYTYDKTIYEGDVQIVSTDTTKYVIYKDKVYKLIDNKVKELKESPIRRIYELAISME